MLELTGHELGGAIWLDLSKFLDDLRAATGAPGGGAAAAVTGAMGCALLQMVSGITLRLPRFTEWGQLGGNPISR